MYNIRKAVPQDFPKVLPMAEAFYNTTTYSAKMEFDFDSILDYYLMMLDMGFILVAETDEGELVGMIGCIVQPFILNKNYNTCTEAMWYVMPEHRIRVIAKELLEAAEDEAKATGCVQMVMSALSTSPASVGPYYERRGYALAETAYLKEI